MPTKLQVFNESLRILGQPLLSTPDQAGEDGKQLRDAYEGAVNWCYEQGNWNSAIERAELAQAATPPSWGYDYYYELPAAFKRLVDISETGTRWDDHTDYQLENGKIATNAATLYIRYISSELVTLTPGEWTQAFSDFVSATLAFRCAPKINASALSSAAEQMENNRRIALGVDAVQNPPAVRKPGSFVRAIRGVRNREQGR